MEVSLEKLANIKANPNNPRLIKDHKFTQLVKSIKDFPEMLKIRPIVVNDDMIVLGGNMRLKACKEAGLTEIPILRASQLSEDQQKEFIIKDNVGFGEWDWDTIANEWDAEQITDWGLDIPGFKLNGAHEDDYEIPDEIQTDIIPGDLFEIGEHRLICGDSSNPDDVDKLLGGLKVDIVLTDPPYGIGIDGQKESKAKNPKHNRKYHEFKGWDSVRPPASLFTSLLAFNVPTIIFGGNYFADLLPSSRGWIYWSKGQDGKLSMSDGELAWTNLNKALRCVTINRANLGDTNHPTQKPVQVIEFSLNYAGVQGDIYDPFIGSGTTMVAAHQLGRKCYGIDIDPEYCQVVVDRMKKLDSQIEIKKNGITL